MWICAHPHASRCREWSMMMIWFSGLDIWCCGIWRIDFSHCRKEQKQQHELTLCEINFIIEICQKLSNNREIERERGFHHHSNIHHAARVDRTGIPGYWTVCRGGKKSLSTHNFCVGVRNFLGLLVIWISDGNLSRKAMCYVAMRSAHFFPGISSETWQKPYETFLSFFLCWGKYVHDDISSSYLWLYFNDMKI